MPNSQIPRPPFERFIQVTRRLVSREVIVRMISADGTQVDDLTDAELEVVKASLQDTGWRTYRRRDTDNQDLPSA